MSLTLKKLSSHSRGKTVLLIHGWAMNSGVWQPLLDAMPEHCFYGLDLPGHGVNSDIDPGNDIMHWFAAAESAINTANIGPYHLVGWSLGGMLATQIAAADVDNCQSLTLIASNPKFVQDEGWPNAMPPVYLEQFMQNLQLDVTQVMRDFMELQVRGAQYAAAALETLLTLVEQGGLVHDSGLKNGLSILQDADTRADLGKLICPVAAILGKRDSLVPVAVADDLLHLQPNLQLHILPKSGHAPFVSHTTETADILNEFFSI